MPNVLSSFLVGIGFDLDKKSMKQTEGAIDGIKKRSLQLGAVVAGAFGIKSLTTDFAQTNDMLGKFSDIVGTSASDLNALGVAAKFEGGTLQSALGLINSIADARAGLLVGDAAIIGALDLAGIDADAITTTASNMEALFQIADDFANSNTLQRINMAQALGIDPQLISLLSQGSEQLKVILADVKAINDVNPLDAEQAAQWNDAVLQFSENLRGIRTDISREILPLGTEMIESINKALEDNGQSIRDKISNLFENPFENIGQGVSLVSPGGVVTQGLITAGEAFTKTFDPAISETSFLQGVLGTRGPVIPPSISNVTTTTSELPAAVNGATGQQKVSVDVMVRSDTAMFKAEVVKISEQANQQAIDDLATSTGG